MRGNTHVTTEKKSDDLNDAEKLINFATSTPIRPFDMGSIMVEWSMRYKINVYKAYSF